MKVAVYLRKSRSDGLEEVGKTLEKHKKILLETAQKENLIIEKIYEEVVSGDSLFSRPQMLLLLQAVENNQYDGVLCMDIDRLGRGGMRDQGIILDTFKNTDTRIITPDKTYNLNNEDDEELTEFKSFMSRRELKIIKKRLQRGLNETIKNGGYVSNPPFGYDSHYINKIPTLKINEEEAQYVKIIFDLYVNKKMGSQLIANYLNCLGIKPKRSDCFGRTSVLAILKNPVYIGKFVRNKSKWSIIGTSDTKKRTRQNLPNEDWLFYNGVHPKIIEPELFFQAQNILKQRKNTKTTSPIVKNPLAGLVRCSKCGKILQRYVVGSKYEYLGCPTKGCIPMVNLTLLENAILKKLQTTMENIKLKIIENDKEKEQYLNIKNKLDMELLKISKQKTTAYNLLEQGVYNTETFTSRMSYLNSHIAKLEEQIKDLSLYLNKENDTNFPVSYPTNLLILYNHCTPKDKNLVLKSMIREITYFNQKSTTSKGFSITIHVKVPLSE